MSIVGTRSFPLDDTDDDRSLPPNASYEESRLLLQEQFPRYLTASPRKYLKPLVILPFQPLNL